MNQPKNQTPPRGPSRPPDAVPSLADSLPLDQLWPEIHATLSRHRNLVLVAEPGAGKTTRLPPLLAQSGLLLHTTDQILVLEPRRLATRAAASRIADEQGWELGGRVGYQVRFENRTTPATQISFLTEGLLARRLQSDPELKRIGAVILDEFHERSLHTDLGLGLLYELQELARPDLRLIVMSATIDAEKIAHFLGDCPIVRVPGRTYPVEVHHDQQNLFLDTGPDFVARVADLVVDIVAGKKKRHGDVLVFLPGAREIRQTHERVRGACDRLGFDCVELHGSMALDDQNRAIRRSSRGKVVLSTNIAETSLTIDGVNTVIDTGLARVMRVDAMGFPRLYLSRISKASATQRAGRAGRQAEGICYRLWNKLDDASMPAFETPEILRADLTDALMTLASQGVSDFASFSWFEAPRPEALAQAREVLAELEFIGPDGQLTPLGREGLKISTLPRLARLLLSSRARGCERLGAMIASLLSEKDIVLKPRELKSLSLGESDLMLRLDLLFEATRGRRRAGGDRGEAHAAESNSYADGVGEARVPLDRMGVRQVLQVADLLESQTRRTNAWPGAAPGARASGATAAPDEAELLQLLLLDAFADRICRRRRPRETQARMVGGKGVQLAPFSTVESAELFFALDGTNAPGGKGDLQVTLASPIDLSRLEADTRSVNRLRNQTRFVFDDEALAVLRETATFFRDLPVTPPKISGLAGGGPGSRTTGDAMEATADPSSVLLQAALDRWESHFLTHPALAGLMARLRFLLHALPEAGVGLDEVFPLPARREFLQEICFGETKLAAVLDKDLEGALMRHLPTEWGERLEREAPKKLRVPSGSLIDVQYPPEQTPFIEVRIQEIFGWTATPRLGPSKRPITIHLLGPNFRPVQVTSDLESFWRTGYAEVRKELRLRYPKHSWPEDPLTGVPEAKGRRRT